MAENLIKTGCNTFLFIFQVFKDRKWLGHISYKSGEMKYKVPPPVVKGPVPEDYQVGGYPAHKY